MMKTFYGLVECMDSQDNYVIKAKAKNLTEARKALAEKVNSVGYNRSLGAVWAARKGRK